MKSPTHSSLLRRSLRSLSYIFSTRRPSLSCSWLMSAWVSLGSGLSRLITYFRMSLRSALIRGSTSSDSIASMCFTAGKKPSSGTLIKTCRRFFSPSIKVRFCSYFSVVLDTSSFSCNLVAGAGLAEAKNLVGVLF